MNKVFKVIWSEARNAYVVVSEMAKSHGTKSCSTKKLLAMLIATGIMTCASVAPAMAANLAPNDTKIEVGKDAKAKGTEGVAIGQGSEDSRAGWATAVGSDAKATGGYSVALGNSAKAKELQTIAIGNDSESSGGSSVAVGTRAKASGGASVAISQDANASGESSMAFGISSTASGGHTIAIGSIAKALSTNAIAIGNQTIADKDNSVAIGPNIKHIGTGAAAVGAQANATGNYSVAMGNLVNVDADWNKNHPGEWRNSGDFSVALGSQSGAWGAVSTAVGALSKAEGDFANAIGSYANASSNYTNAMGLYSAASADYANAIGSYAKANVEYSVALGSASVADREAGVVGAFAPEGADSLTWRANGGAVSVGSATITRQITNVAAGTADTDAVNVSQLKAVGATANMGWNLATNGVATEATNVKPGDYVDFSGDKNISVSHDGTKVKVELNKDLVGIESISNGDAKMALNGAAGTAGMINGKGASIYMQDGYTVINSKVAFDQNGKISGVAAGEADTDAVNVGQLKNSAWKLAANGVLTEAEDVKAGDYVDFNGDQNISVSKDAKDGVNTVKVELNKDLVGIESISNGDAKMALNGAAGTAGMINGKGASIYMQDGYTVINSKVAFDQNGKITGVAAGAITADSTDAVNGSQLHAVATEAGKHSKVVNGSNINVEEFDNDGQKIYKVNLNKDIMLGDLTGKYVNISGTNGTIETTGYIATKDRVYADKGAKLADIDVTGDTISNGASSIVLDGSNVKVNDKVTIDQDGKISGVAAGEVSSTSTDAINGSQLNQTNENVAQNKADIAANRADIDKNKADIAQNKADIAQNKADIAQNKADIAQNKADIAQNKADIAQNKTDIKTLNTRVDNVEELAKKHTTVTAGNNIAVTEDTNTDGGKEYKVALKNKIDLGDKGSVTTGQTVMNNDGLKVGDKVSVTATAVTAGKTSISDEGVKVGDKTYISDKGLNANDQKVTNVAAGEISATSKDAVNGSQLYKTNQEVANNTNRINKLGSRVNKVGAGAAALAALHPMDFDPDDKLTFSAGYGNYGGENAAAIGAYYRPDEKVMFSVAGTVGNGENMVNAGVSFALDRTNHVSNSRTALAREVIDLRGQLAVMGAKMAKMEKAFGMLDETKTKLFPDVPANHWAYEYIAKLAGNGYIEGYPDGNFGGDRLMTRYEFAAMLYRAIENGAALEEKIIKEFEPELGRIRVDRISGEDGDRDKIERVRVNDTKGERDHYGNKLAK